VKTIFLLCTSSCHRISYALREAIVPVLQIFFKIVFRNSSQYQCHVAFEVRNASKSLSLQGISYFSTEPKTVRRYVRWICRMVLFCNGFLCQELTKSYIVMSRCIAIVGNPSERPEFGILLRESILDLRVSMSVLCPQLHLTFASAIHFLGHLTYIALLWTAYAITKH
jgi:hypothetical protein